MAEARRGAREHPTRGRRPADERKRREQMRASLIDGYHFRDLADAEADAGGGGGPEWAARKRRWLVAEKVLVPHPSGGEVVAYMPGDPDASRPSSVADYGTTLTAALFLPGSSEVYIAHAGDSDAYAFRRGAGPDGGRVPMRLTSDHTVRNPQEAARMAAHGMSVQGQYFVLPGVASLMPSRSIGHTLLSKHGVTHEPTVSVTRLQRGDVVLVASDGLWSGYGRCVCDRERRSARGRRGGGTSFPASALGRLQGAAAMREEDVSALRVAEVMAASRRGGELASASTVMREVEAAVSVRDNIIVVGVEVV